MRRHNEKRPVRTAIFLALLSLSGLTVGSAEAATVSLAWDPAPAGAGVASYLVRYGTATGLYPSSSPCGLSTQCTVTVPNNQTYYFVVLAIGSGGLQSPPSSEVVARVGTTSILIGLNQTTISFPAEGGTADLAVFGSAQWSATSNSSWTRVMPGAAGTGTGAFSYAVTPNAGPTPRSSIMSVGGVNVAITQPAGPPTAWRLPTDLSPTDYDGDGKTDVTVYRDTTGEWFTLKSATNALQYSPWGAPSLDDIPVPADYDGDNRADVAVFRRSSGEWFVLNSLGGSTTIGWGAPTLGDLPVPSDYDGDGHADIGVYRGSTGQWIIYLSSGGTRSDTWGAPSLGDVPIPADYDGDGVSDIAVYRGTTGEWFISKSTGGWEYAVWGAPSFGDVPVPGDYDGDDRVDVAVYRGTSGQWFIVNSGGGTQTISWGTPAQGDIPVPGDYDGDGRTDAAVYRSSTGEWLFSYSAGGAQTIGWGAPSLNDIVRGR